MTQTGRYGEWVELKLLFFFFFLQCKRSPEHYAGVYWSAWAIHRQLQNNTESMCEGMRHSEWKSFTAQNLSVLHPTFLRSYIHFEHLPPPRVQRQRPLCLQFPSNTILRNPKSAKRHGCVFKGAVCHFISAPSAGCEVTWTPPSSASRSRLIAVETKWKSGSSVLKTFPWRKTYRHWRLLP